MTITQTRLLAELMQGISLLVVSLSGKPGDYILTACRVKIYSGGTVTDFTTLQQLKNLSEKEVQDSINDIRDAVGEPVPVVDKTGLNFI